MVKNTQGGSKHKSQARKLVNAPISSKIRTPECDDECFAIVSKMLGNGMCHVNISHQNSIISNIVCHIRGKFRGRNKKANFVSTSSIILVGLRTWEANINSCDLICIYQPHQFDKLIIDQNLYSSIDDSNRTHTHNAEFSFSNDIIDNLPSTTTTNLSTHDTADNDNDVDFDLI
tara:strand:+ start:140 stop:661 length:522 start_codon:yes stop_codon:yes gene_type:complete